MEYQEAPEITVYKPGFGYLHDPDDEEKDLYDRLDADGVVRTYVRREGVTMPRPKNDPLRLLIFAVCILIAIIVSVILVARTEYALTTFLYPLNEICQQTGVLFSC